jgi:hypothetical protein
MRARGEDTYTTAGKLSRQETIMQGETYNGWRNRETWATALWLSNDYMLYRLTCEVVRVAVRDGERVDDAMREHVEALFALDVAPDGMRGDVGSLWRVDWQEVADSFSE